MIGPLLRELGLPESMAAALAGLAGRLRSQPFRLLHADITRANILGSGFAAVLVDFGLAVYGPPDYETAVLRHRDLHSPADYNDLPDTLRPFVALLEAQRVLNDLVRLVQHTNDPDPDSVGAHGTALYLSLALPRVEELWAGSEFTTGRALDVIGGLLARIETLDTHDEAPLYVTDAGASMLGPDSGTDPGEPVYIVTEPPVEPR